MQPVGNALDPTDRHLQHHDEASSTINDPNGDAALSLIRSFDSHDELITTFVKSNSLEEHEVVFQNAALLASTDASPEELPNITPKEIEYLRSESTRKWHQPRTLYFSICMCSLGAIEQGMAQTSMNGANLYFPKEFGIDSSSLHDTFIVGLINSGIYLSVGLM
jgi:hypothetical protein